MERAFLEELKCSDCEHQTDSGQIFVIKHILEVTHFYSDFVEDVLLSLVTFFDSRTSLPRAKLYFCALLRQKTLLAVGK